MRDVDWHPCSQINVEVVGFVSIVEFIRRREHVYCIPDRTSIDHQW